MLPCTEIKSCRGSRSFRDQLRRAVAKRQCRVQLESGLHPTQSLQGNVDRNPRAGISAVVKIVAIVDVIYVHVVIVVPVISPIFRPRIDGADPVSLVLKAWVSPHNPEGKSIDAESVAGPKVSAVAIVRDTVSVIATTLLPGAMIRLPVL